MECCLKHSLCGVQYFSYTMLDNTGYDSIVNDSMAQLSFNSSVLLP